MNTIIRAAITHSRIVLLILVLLLIAGTQTYISIPKESNPDVTIPIIYTRVHMDGISPEDAESAIVQPLEQELSGVEGAKKMESQAYESGGSVTLTFKAGFDVKKALDDVRERVDKVKSQLPADADDPVVSEVNLSKFPVLVVSLAGNVPERTLYAIAERAQDSIETINTVLEVNVKGKRSEMVEIIVDPIILESYGLTESDLMNAMARNNRLIAAGTLDTGAGRFPVKIPGTVKTAEELYNMPLKASDGRVVRFRDIAQVRRVFKDINSVARVDGAAAVTLEVVKRTGENLIDTIAAVKKTIDDLRVRWPNSVTVTYYGDQSPGVKNMLQELQNNVLTAVLLVVVVIIAAMGVRSAALVAVAVPGSFVIGILVIGQLGLTINMVVLFSLIMAVGMLVDGAIVVAEYADRRLIEGKSKKEAFIEAAQRMSWPIIASTATTLAAFLPLLYFPGVPGQFMKYLPITLIATLSASLLMALIFVPTLGGLIGGAGPTNSASERNLYLAEHGDFLQMRGITGIYVRFVNWATHYPISILFIVLAILYATFSVYGRYGRGVEFFPSIEPERIIISVRARGDLSIKERDEILSEVEQRILQVPEVRTSYAATELGGGRAAEDLVAKIEIELHDWDQRTRKAAEVITSIRNDLNRLPGLVIEVQEQADGPGGSDKPIQLAFTSSDREAAVQAVLDVRQWMQEHGGFADIEDTLPLPGIEWRVEVDREEAGRYGADVSLVGTFVQLVTGGIKLSSYRPDGSTDELDIRARYPADKRNLSQLTKLRVPTRDGYVPASQFVDIVPGNKLTTIDRLNSKRVYRIKASAKPLPGEQFTNLGQLAAKRLRLLNDLGGQIDLPLSIDVLFEGQDEDQKEAMTFLANAFAVALTIMAGIMVMQFNSFYQTFLVMSAVVLCLGGVLIGLMIIQEAFSIIMCGIGVVALAGIVVNNNIVLIDTFNELRGRGMAVREAAVRTAAQRFRPVMLTSITTVLGLLPMIMRLNIDLLGQHISYNAPSSQWWVQMATTLGGGMAFATVLTLLLTPSLLMAHALLPYLRMRKQARKMALNA